MRGGERTLTLLLAPIAAFLDDVDVREIVIQQPGEVGVERADGWTWHAIAALTFERLDQIATLAAAMSGQDVGPGRPLCASTLPGGQRVQICRPPAVAQGRLSLTIRRPSSFAPTITGLAQGGLFARTVGRRTRVDPVDAELAALHAAGRWDLFFPRAVAAKKTILITGDVGSGKTTFAKALIAEMPLAERLVTIEDTAEFVDLPHRNLVQLYYSKGDQGIARVAPADLIEAALRMRPDRILMQELRDGAAFVYLRALASGHPGGITTCHAGSAAGALDAVRLMVKQHEAGRHLSDHDVQALVRNLVDVVAHCRRDARGFGLAEVLFEPAMAAAAFVAAAE